MGLLNSGRQACPDHRAHDRCGRSVFCVVRERSVRHARGRYESNARNAAGGRCAVPDDALDHRVAGRQGRGGRGGAESPRDFQRNVLAAALHVRPTAWLFAVQRAGHRPGIFRASAGTKYLEPRRSGEGKATHLPARRAAELSAEATRTDERVKTRRRASRWFRWTTRSSTRRRRCTPRCT